VGFRQSFSRSYNRGVSSLVRFYRYVLRHPAGAAVVFLASLVSAATALPVPLLVRAVIDDALPSRDTGLLVALVAGICVAWLVSHGLMIAGSYGAAWVRENVHLAVRQDLFEHLQAQPVRYFEDRETGGLVSRLTNDVAAVQGLIGERLFEAAGELVYLVGGAVILVRLDWRLALVSLVTLPLVSAIFALLRRRLHTAQLRLQESQEDLSARLFESLAGIRVVQAFGLESREARRTREHGTALKRVQLRKQLVTSVAAGLGIVLTLVPVAVVVWGFGGSRVLSGALSLGTLIAFYHYLGTFFRPMGVIFRLVAELLGAIAAADRVFEVLDQPPAVTDPAGGGVRPEQVEGRIELADVSFEHVEGQRALDEVTLSIEPGEVVGLVGPSGAGKTTLAHLLVRFADPTSGAVRLDGHDLRDLSLARLREVVGLVSQDVFLFNDTVRENLRVGSLGASDDEVARAAEAIGAAEFIERLSDGYDTVIGERGARLSGGQRQLLALGRILLRDPRVLVFDEATSALDPATEARLQDALETAMSGRTTIIIAHRWSTLRLARRIVVLDHGRVAGQGAHEDLLSEVAVYRELTAAQQVGV
jgi:subfamily B ATP-binding cassette protein MsbA